MAERIGGRGAVYTAIAVAATALLGVLTSAALSRAGGGAADPALERTREQVRMLDDLYKNVVVSVTNRYDDPPAIRVAIDAMTAMAKAGWHQAKLVDASGAPRNEENRPRTAFEERAAEAMRSGKAYYEEVAGEGEGRRLHAATVVPAVTERCARCHGVKRGELLGFIRYDVPIK